MKKDVAAVIKEILSVLDDTGQLEFHISIETAYRRKNSVYAADQV